MLRGGTILGLVTLAVVAGVALVGLVAHPHLARVVGPTAGVPDGLDVTHKTVSHLKATYRSGGHVIHAETTNRSMAAHHNDPADVATAPFLVRSEGHTVHGHEISVVQIMDQTFLHVSSVNDKMVTLQVPIASSWEEFANKERLQLMYNEAPRIHVDIQRSNRAYGTAVDEIFSQHPDKLKSFVDLAWQLGSVHNLNGIDYPHLVAFLMLAKETAAALKYDPGTSDRADTISAHRRLQSKSCQHHNCGMSGQCSGSDCRGMCGPSCYQCWSSICNTCCWMQFCESHDDCCSRVGMTGSACWRVLQNYMGQRSGISCYSHYSCVSVFNGH